MKKVKRLLALGAAALMLTSAFAMPASAANIKNTTWNFNIESTRRTYTTALREKTNSSSVYVKYSDGTVTSLVCDALNSEGDSMCGSYGPGRIYKGEEGRLKQLVYENGFRWCKLKLTCDAPVNYGGAGGEWSPDCVGSYPYLN